MNTLLVVISSFLYATKPIFLKLAYLEGTSVNNILLLRYMISAIILFVSLVILGKTKNLLSFLKTKDFFLIGGLSFLCFYLSAKSDFLSINELGVGISRTIVFTYPIFIYLFMLIVGKEKVSARDVIILILLQFALLITITGENINFDKVNLLGIIYSLSASIFYGLYLILAEDKAKHINGGVFSFFLILWGLVFMLFDYNILYQPQKITEINIDSIFWVVMLAIFSTILPVYLLNEGMRKIGSSKAAATTILNPAFAILLAFLIFNEEFDRIQLIGISMIIALIYLFNRKKKTI